MATEEHSEVERKYDVDPEVALPDLSVLPGVVGVAPSIEVEQTATYLDTPDLKLLAAQVTLRRRTGGLDDGWHLKLPHDGDRREEVRVPLDEAVEPPSELIERVRGLTRGARLEPSAVLVTRRRVHRLLGEGGVVLAELCDDRVTATTSSQAPTIEEWREWELELVEGGEELLDAAEPLLVEAGARPSAAPSKLARVLAEALSTRPRWQERASLDGNPTVGQVLCAYVARHLANLERQDQLVRSGDQEGVHQLRVAARRLRSALTTYTPILDPDVVTDLRAELKWFGGVLSGARDAQVQRQRLSALVGDQPTELVLGPVADRITEELRERFLAGRAVAVAALDGERYFRLVDRLEDFLLAPPLMAEAGMRARKAVPDLVQAELDRLRKRDRAHQRANSPRARDLTLHEVRKSAKRLRYAAETAQPVFGNRATQLAARAEALQELLGEHQDSVVSRATLYELGVRAHETGANAFTFGLLYAAEISRAGVVEQRYPDVLAQLPRKDLGAWLRK